MKSFVLLLLVVVPFGLSAQSGGSSSIRGADVSFTTQIEDLGGTFKIGGVSQDLLDVLKANGVTSIRLRLWHTPTDGYCGLEKTLVYAQRVKAKGLDLLLDIHYSDWWADPGKQNKPAAWATATYAALKESVYTYTRRVLEAMKAQNTVPQMVQVGNEITSGMLWPDGRVGGSTNPTTSWQQLGELVKEGIRGARDGAADSTMRIMIHIDRGGDNSGSRWFFDNLLAQGVQFDVIGLSYYPWWHGTFTQLRNNVQDLAVRYGKDIVIAETAYPWTTSSLSDSHGNIGVNAATLPDGYPISAAGQKSFLAAVRKILKDTPNGRGIGFYYWEPGYISVAPIGSSWEHLTLFDFAGSGLTSLSGFANTDTLTKVRVTMRFNAATVGDTLRPTGLMELRGEIKGMGSNLLPSGELVTWDEFTQLRPANIGGDLWETNFSMYTGDRIEFKIWTGHTAAKPTSMRLGWEGPITPYDASALNGRLYIASTTDTVLPVQFYNWFQSTAAQFATPIAPRNDSVGVLFRVNMSRLTGAGMFDPVLQGPVTVRGDSIASGGTASWFKGNVVLQRETLSVSSGSMWSGVAYIPKSIVSAGTPIAYRFAVENGPLPWLEPNVADRIFTRPWADTTLTWVWFNDGLVPTGVGDEDPSVPVVMQLSQNYPNPFNGETVVEYRVAGNGYRATGSWDRESGSSAPNSQYSITNTQSRITNTQVHVSLKIYDLLGRVVAVLVDGPQPDGEHTVVWNAAGMSSGFYTIVLTSSNGERLARRALLIR